MLHQFLNPLLNPETSLPQYFFSLFCQGHLNDELFIEVEVICILLLKNLRGRDLATLTFFFYLSRVLFLYVSKRRKKYSF